MEVADQRHVDAHAIELFADVRHLRRGLGVFTVMRTSSEPAMASSFTWIAVPIGSAVSVLVIDCTRTGASPPMVTTREPHTARAWREWREAEGRLDGQAGFH